LSFKIYFSTQPKEFNDKEIPLTFFSLPLPTNQIQNTKEKYFIKLLYNKFHIIFPSISEDFKSQNRILEKQFFSMIEEINISYSSESTNSFF
jgi:hypothetical protein